MVKKYANTKIKDQPILHLNLRIFFVIGLVLIFFLSPFLKGLFFQAELLPMYILIGISFIFCCYDQVLKREMLLQPAPLDWAMAAIILAYMLSLITAVHMRPAIGELLKVIAYFMVYWMAYRAVRDEKSMKLLLIILYLAGIGVALIGLTAAAGLMQIPGTYVNGRILSTLQYPNTLAVYLTAVNLIGLALGVKSEGLLPRLLYAAGNMILIVVIVGTQSRGGWILFPLAIGLFIYLIHYRYRWRAVYHVMIFLGCGMVAAQGFFNNIKAGNNGALSALLYGLAAVLLFQALYYYMGHWLNQDSVKEHTRKMAATGGMIYLGIVFLVYLSYAAAAFPVATAGFLPGDAILRAQHISGQEHSFQARMDFNADALKIIKDYPLTGSGGGGWNALYHSYADRLYWTTETHNYFFQTWVESGTIGFLALAAVVVLFVRLLLLFRRKLKQEDESEEILVWAVAAAVLVLLIHSSFDFDLSMAAIGFLLYGLIGMVKGRITSAGISSAIRISRGALTDKTAPQKKGILVAAAGTVLSLALIYPAWSFYQAGTAGAEGAKALRAGAVDEALPYYMEAIHKDPFTASYLVDLAQIRALQSQRDDDAIAYFEALRYGKKASQAAPYDSRVHIALINLYSSMGEEELMLDEADALLCSNPLVVSNYAIAAAALLDAAHHEIQAGNNQTADSHLQEILNIPDQLPDSAEEPGGDLHLALGQAALLLGDTQQARQYLTNIKGDEQLNYQAQLWLAATCASDRDADKAQILLAEAQKHNEKAASDFQQILAIINKHSS